MARIHSAKDGLEVEQDVSNSQFDLNPKDIISNDYYHLDYDYLPGQGPRTARVPLGPDTKRQVIYERKEIIYSTTNPVTHQPTVTKRIIETRTIKPVSKTSWVRRSGRLLKDNLWDRPLHLLRNLIVRPLHALTKPIHWLLAPLFNAMEWTGRQVLKPFQWIYGLIPSWVPMKWMIPLLLLPLLAFFLWPLLPAIFSPVNSLLPGILTRPFSSLYQQGNDFFQPSSQWVTERGKIPAARTPVPLETTLPESQSETYTTIYRHSHKRGKEEEHPLQEEELVITKEKEMRSDRPLPLVNREEGVIKGHDRHVYHGQEHDPMTPSELQRQKQIITLEIQPDPNDEWTHPRAPQGDMEVIPNAIPEQPQPLHWRPQYP